MDRKRIAAKLAGGVGHVDLCARLVVGDVRRVNHEDVWSNEEVLLVVGGRWDLEADAWSDDEATEVVTFRVHRGQEAAARWFAEWLRRYILDDWDGYDRKFTLMLRGGRRSGKTHLCSVFVVLFVVAVQGRIAAGTSTIGETSFEVDASFQSLMPSTWYTRTQPKKGPVTFDLRNRSVIRLFSGRAYHKSGRVDLPFMNEAQDQPRATYVKVSGAIVDTGGLVLTASNPADSADGAWVDELFAGKPLEDGGDPPDVARFDLHPKNNPLISQAALQSLRKTMTKQEASRELDGKEAAFGNAVMYAWTAERNWIDPDSSWTNVTAEVLKKKLGVDAPVGVCMDFQASPFMFAGVMEIWRDRAGELHHVCVEEVYVEGDEAALSRAIIKADSRVDPATTPVIMDASGFFQSGDHHEGRTSEKTLRGCGWKRLLKPQPDSDRNPSVKERLKNGNRLLLNDLDESRLHVAKKCARLAADFKKWKKVNGIPSGKSEHSHGPTAVTYWTFRLEPPAAVKTEGKYIPVKRFSRSDEMRRAP